MPARIALVAVAVAAVAWMALGIRTTGRETRADRIAVGATARTPAAERAAAERTFAAAGRLNPDSRPDLARAAYRLGTRNRRGAVAVLERVVRREPDNIFAWGLLALAADRVNRALSARAQARVRELNPRGARRPRPAAPRPLSRRGG